MAYLSPDFKVMIWNWNEELIEVRLLTLMAWKHHLKMELAGFKKSGGSVFAIVRKELSIPKVHSKQFIYEHICTSLDSIKQQLESGENSE